MSCKVELVEKKDLLTKLEASKMSIKDLFKDLLDEIKGFKYQVKTLLRKDKQNGETEFALVYFNSTTKTVIIINLILTNLFKKFCTGLITGLMKNLAGFLNQLVHNTLTFQLTDC